MRSPKRIALALAAGAVLIAVAVAIWLAMPPAGHNTAFAFAVTDAELSDPARIDRGRYLAVAGNCATCHTVDDEGYMAGGLPLRTDFGTIHSTNITPDDETGIGAWTADEFLRSMRFGIRADGEHLYPAFPYTSFTKATDEDLLDLFAYLRSLPPVRRASTANDLIFPFDRRALVGIWKALFFEPGELAADPTRDAEWNRGAYLVEALAHCGECHSPRNALGGIDRDRAMSGGAHFGHVPGGAVRRWSAPNLTSAESGLGIWSPQDLFDYLATGRNEFLETFGPMNEVILPGTRHLDPEDVSAMVTYLKSLPAIESDPGPEPDARLLGMGRTQYNLHCGTCHLPTGEGDPEMAPRIGGGSLVVRADDPAALINVILYGPELAELHPPSTWRSPMEEFQYLLTDDEVAAVASFVRYSWSNGASRVSVDQVARQR